MNAAVDYEKLAPASSESEPETMADKLRADGGRRDQHEDTAECECSNLSGGFTCWPCVRDGKRDSLNRVDRELGRFLAGS